MTEEMRAPKRFFGSGSTGDVGGQPYRLALYQLRVSMFGNAILLVMVLLLATALVVLAHRENLRPFFITADLAQNRVFRVEPVYGNVRSFDLVSMTIARRYVVLRETLDGATEETRWAEASWLSNADVQNRFAELMKGKDSPLPVFKQRKRLRSVEVVSSAQVAEDSATRRTFLVEFRLIDREPNQPVETKIYQVTITTEAHDADIKFNDALLNPYGVQVIAYSPPQEKRGAVK